MPQIVGTVLVIILIIFILLILASCIKIVPQAQALVVERLGAYMGTWGVGIHFKAPFIYRVAKRITLKEQVVDFAPQPVITKDNVTMRIDTVPAGFHYNEAVVAQTRVLKLTVESMTGKRREKK